MSGAGGRSGARERVPPSFLACLVAGARVGTVAVVALVLAFGHRALLGHGTKCRPCRVRSAGRVAWRGSLRCGLGGMVPVSNLLGAHLRVHLVTASAPAPAAAEATRAGVEVAVLPPAIAFSVAPRSHSLRFKSPVYRSAAPTRPIHVDGVCPFSARILPSSAPAELSAT